MLGMYKKYIKIKQNISCLYKGYDIEKIMSIDIADSVYGNDGFLKIKNLAVAFLCKEINLPSESTSSVLFSMGPYGGRRDYYEIMEYARVGVRSDYIDLKDIRWRPSFNLKNLITSLYFIFRSEVDLGFTIKLILACKMSHYKNTIDYIENNNFNNAYKKYCSFCSALAYEAILDQYYRKRGVTTYTLQHGLYFIFKNPPVDAIAYENMISDNLLCWGGFTKDEFIKFGISESRLKIAGYPRPVKTLKPYCIGGEKINILLLCARNKFDQNNQEMLAIVHEFAQQFQFPVQVIIKTHPSLDQSEYKKIAQDYGFGFSEQGTIKNLISDGKFDFAIAYNSTAYVDSYLNNLIALHYDDADRENDAEVMDDRFSTAQELKEKIQKFVPLVEKTETWESVSKKLHYLVGCGVNKYAEYLHVE